LKPRPMTTIARKKKRKERGLPGKERERKRGNKNGTRGKGDSRVAKIKGGGRKGGIG